MKFSKLSQLFLVSAIGLDLATFLTACILSPSTMYFWRFGRRHARQHRGRLKPTQPIPVRRAAPGQSPVCSGGTTPVALAVSPDFKTSMSATRPTNGGPLLRCRQRRAYQRTQSPRAHAGLSGRRPAGNALYVVSGSTSATLTEYALTSGTIGSPTSQLALTVPVHRDRHDHSHRG